MLDCWVSTENGGVSARPAELNLQQLSGRFHIERQRVEALLTEADAEKSTGLRSIGVQAFIRLQNYAECWVNAFKFCGPIIDFARCDLGWELDLLGYTFSISPEEIALLADASTKVKICKYSGQQAGTGKLKPATILTPFWLLRHDF